VLPFVLLGLATALGLGTLALWSQSIGGDELFIDNASVGFSLTQGEVTTLSTGEPVGFTVGRSEAEELVTGGMGSPSIWAVAVPFTVTMGTTHGYGMDYSISAEEFDELTVLGFGGASPAFFRVHELHDCTPTATGDNYLLGEVIEGIEPGSYKKEIRTDHWCVVFTITPGHYRNTVAASGINVLGISEQSVDSRDSSWEAYLLPDPTHEPDVTITLTPLVRGES
jgi:hypothetical protein